MNEYQKSLLFLKKLSKTGSQQHLQHKAEIETHLSRIIPSVESWIRQRHFEPVQECLKQLRDLDAAMDFTALLGDYKWSYFICINSAYVVQQ